MYRRSFCSVLAGILLVPLSASAAQAAPICTDDILAGLPIGVCIQVPSIEVPPLLPVPQAPAPAPEPIPEPAPIPQPAPAEPQPIPVAPSSPQPGSAPAQGVPVVSDPDPEIPPQVEDPDDLPEGSFSPDDEATDRHERSLLPLVVGGTILVVGFFVSRLIEDLRNFRAKRLANSKKIV